MLFDTHAHLTDKRFDDDRDAVLTALPEKGVGLVLNPGCDMPDSRAAAALSEIYPFVYAAAGIHPHEAANRQPEDIAALHELAKLPKVCAIGEIGLDYHYDFSPRDIQKRVFREQLELARELDLPVIVHDREAHADCLEILADFTLPRVVFHCYSGSLEMSRELVRRGYYLSFTGVVTFANARKSLEIVKELPPERIMIETDAPYLTPAPHRGRRNDPGYAGLVADAVAQVRGVTPEEIARQTWKNGIDFFGIQPTKS